MLSLPLLLKVEVYQLFDRVALPVVLYASEIYEHYDSCIKKLEIFQRSLFKKALKLSLFVRVQYILLKYKKYIQIYNGYIQIT